ncbi:hypothetical protein ACFL1X_09300 [Candidatus Hydrogenedentota bacterium]
MKCPACNKKQKASHNFCPWCGKDIEAYRKEYLDPKVAARPSSLLSRLFLYVGIPGIIAALVFPNIMRTHPYNPEMSAIGALYSIKGGQIGFSAAKFLDADSDGVGDFAPLGPISVEGTLANPAEGEMPFIDEQLGSGEKGGYVFIVIPYSAGKGKEGYVAVARPVKYGKTGVLSFFMDQSGIITFTNEKRMATASDEPVG